MKGHYCFAIIWITLQLYIIWSKKKLLPLRYGNSPIVKLAVIEVNYYIFLRFIDYSIKAFVGQIYIELIATIVDDFSVDDVHNIFVVFYGWGKVVSLNFIKCCIFPIEFGGRTKLSVSTSDSKMGVLNGNLIKVMVIEEKSIRVSNWDEIEFLANRETVIPESREDSINKFHLPFALIDFYVFLKLCNLTFLLNDEIENGCLIDWL